MTRDPAPDVPLLAVSYFLREIDEKGHASVRAYLCYHGLVNCPFCRATAKGCA